MALRQIGQHNPGAFRDTDCDTCLIQPSHLESGHDESLFLTRLDKASPSKTVNKSDVNARPDRPGPMALKAYPISKTGK